MMFDTTQETFSRDVVETSRETAVLVDFWAPWCGPCKMLSPLLSAVEAEFKGRLRVVKLNIDENQELAARFGVRSIPFVVAFVDGQPVDSFVGVLPAESLRRFVGKLLPDPAEIERRKGQQLLNSGDYSAAAIALRAAIALDPERDAARMDLAALLLEHTEAQGTPSRLDEVDTALAGVSAAGKLDARWISLHTQAESQRRAAQLPAAATLRARVEADPADLQARQDLASLHVACREFEQALDQLLAIVERDRGFGDDVGRRTMLSVFDLAADQPQLVSSYRRRLAAVLNR
jgi:putative thioredoxin